MPRRIEPHWIAGPAGRLVLLEEPEHETPLIAALVCHPHPLFGGTMHTKAVHRLIPADWAARARWRCASTSAARVAARAGTGT